MKLEITAEEARILKLAVARQIHWLEAELVHTDKHELQHDLAAELAGVRRFADRLGAAIVGDAPRPAEATKAW